MPVNFAILKHPANWFLVGFVMVMMGFVLHSHIISSNS